MKEMFCVWYCHSEEEWNDDEESRKTYLFVLDLSLRFMPLSGTQDDDLRTRFFALLRMTGWGLYIEKKVKLFINNYC